MDGFVFLTRQGDYYGKNGSGKLTGVYVDERDFLEKPEVHVAPVNTKGTISSGCYLNIPVEDIGKVSEALSQGAIKAILNVLGKEMLPLLLTTGNKVVTQMVSDILSDKQ